MDGSFYQKHIMIEPVDMRARAKTVMLARFGNRPEEKKETFIVMEKEAAKELGRQIGSKLFKDLKIRFTSASNVNMMESFFTVEKRFGNFYPYFI